MPELTRIERKILANQYTILEKIDPENAESHQESRKIVASGYEGEYGGLLQDIYDGEDVMAEEECSYVNDVLHMYDMMQTAYKNGKTEGVDPKRLTFPGFDGNNETKFMSYARFMRDHGRRDFLELKSQDFNSHFPTAQKYAEMLKRWNASADKLDLTAADVVRILD